MNKKVLSDIVKTALITLLVAVVVAAIWVSISQELTGQDKETIDNPYYVCDHLQGVKDGYKFYYYAVESDMKDVLNYYNASNASIYKEEMWRWTREGPVQIKDEEMTYTGNVVDVTCNLKYIMCLNLPSKQNCGTTNFRQVYINKTEWDAWVNNLDYLEQTVRK